jgi:RNA recognition motif-containing protein
MNIYIAGLSYSMNDADLANLFASYGEVTSAKVIMDNYTQKSRGFGFVEMPDVKAGQTAIEELNGKDVEGKTLIVNVAKERTERRPSNRGGYGRDSRGGGGFNRGGNRDRDSRPPRRY